MRRLSVLANEALALERKGHTKPETQPVHASLDGSIKMWMRPENHPDLKAWLASPRLKAAVRSYLPNAYERAGVVALRLGDGVKALPEIRTPSVVDREIVAKKCADGSIEGTVPSGVSH